MGSLGSCRDAKASPTRDSITSLLRDPGVLEIGMKLLDSFIRVDLRKIALLAKDVSSSHCITAIAGNDLNTASAVVLTQTQGSLCKAFSGSTNDEKVSLHVTGRE